MVERRETCSLATVRRVAAMLDIDPDTVAADDALPRGWQFVLLGADTRRSALRSDGFPGLGIPMPDLGLPRLMLAGRSVSFHADIPIGASVRRASAMQSLRHKASAAGPMAVVTLVDELHVDGHDSAAIVETRTYLLMSASKAKPYCEPRKALAGSTRLTSSTRFLPPKAPAQRTSRTESEHLGQPSVPI